MSASTSSVSQELRAAASSVSNAVDIAIDNIIQVNPETCEMPLSTRAAAIVASGGAGAHVGHTLARRVHYVQRVPRVGPIVHAAIDAVATAAGGIQGMSIANDVIDSRVKECEERRERELNQIRSVCAKMRTLEYNKELDYVKRIELLDKAIREEKWLEAENPTEMEIYKNVLMKIRKDTERDYLKQLEDLKKPESIIAQAEYKARLAQAASAAAVPSPAPTPAPVLFSALPRQSSAAASPFLRVPLGSSSIPAEANSQAAASFMSGTNVGLTNRAPMLSSWQTLAERGRALRAASSGQTAVAADANRRFGALMARPAAASVAVAQSPVVVAPPRAAPAPQPVFDRNAFVRAMFSSGGGGSGGIGISFGF